VVHVFCALAILGAALYSLLAPFPETPDLDAVSSSRSVIAGLVVRDPDMRENAVLMTVSMNTLNGQPISGRILATADRFTDVAYGDRVSVNGIVDVPKNFETDTGRTFNYRKYLLASGITHVVSFAKVSVIAHDQGNPLVSSLLSIKHLLLSGLQTALPEPESALAAGLLLGEKQSLGKDITDAFRKAGVIHIIVLSGYNVSLVISTLRIVVSYFLPRVWALTIAAIGIVAFAIMTGASETTIRASIMALIVLLAQGLHRPSDGIRILLIAAAGMAVWNPYLVLYDLSYQLSILATLGLILFSNRISKKLTLVPETLGLREIVGTTIGTQLTVLPLLIISVGQVSLVSILANVIVLPAVPLAMLASFIAGMASLASFVIAIPFSFVAYVVLTFIIRASVFLGSLPFASVPIPPEWMWPTLAVLCVFYLAGFLYWLKKKAP
jgi:competence protein ComEC